MGAKVSWLLKHLWLRVGAAFLWLHYITTMLFSFAVEVFRPSTWREPVKDRLSRQLLFTGVEALPFTILVALFVGCSVYIQCLIWLQYTGKVEFLAEMISTLLIREVAPFLASFIVIAASASAMTTELATMKVSGQVALLESQGINLFRFLAVPRMLGVAVCVTVLSIVFCAAAFCASAIGFILSPDILHRTFFNEVFNAMKLSDVVILLTKGFVPGLATGAICCYEGLKVGNASTEIPQAVSQAMLRAVTAGVFIWGLILVISFFLSNP